MSGGFASSGFEIGNVLDRRSYPEARRNRTGPPPAAGAGVEPGIAPPASFPQSRQFWFESSSNGFTRSCSSSQKLRGPSIILSFAWAKSGATDATNQWLELGKAFTPVNEVNVALASAKAYITLIEKPSTPMAVMPAAFNGFPALSSDAPDSFGEYNARIIVPDRDWFLVFACGNNTAGGISFRGVVTVLDQVDPFALAAYVG